MNYYKYIIIIENIILNQNLPLYRHINSKWNFYQEFDYSYWSNIFKILKVSANSRNSEDFDRFSKKRGRKFLTKSSVRKECVESTETRKNLIIVQGSFNWNANVIFRIIWKFLNFQRIYKANNIVIFEISGNHKCISSNIQNSLRFAKSWNLKIQ